MAFIKRIFSDGRLMGSGIFSDALIMDAGNYFHIYFSGMAAIDPESGNVAGYESHNGLFNAEALEMQVADIFVQLDRLCVAVSEEISKPVSAADLIRAMVFLKEDHPMVFGRFNDAYTDEFKKRGIGDYPTRTTVMKTNLPAPSALVEIQFEAAVKK